MKPLEEEVRNYIGQCVEVNLARGYGLDSDSGEVIYRRKGRHTYDAKHITGILLKMDGNNLVLKVEDREYPIPLNAVRACEGVEFLGAHQKRLA